MKYVLGLDGGGTKLLCLLVDQNGNLVGEAKSGPTNRNFNTEDEIKLSIRTVIDEAVSQNHIEKRDILIVYAAMPVDSEFGLQVISECLHEETIIHICGEFIPSLFGAILKDYGGLALSGTGSFATLRVKREEGTGLWNTKLGEGGKDEYFSVGAWGAIIGDEGSGFYIGRKALTAFAEMIDGRREPTILKDKIFKFFGTSDLGEVVRAIYPKNSGKQRTLIASLCPVVAECAKSGDPVSIGILEDAANQLALQIITAIKKSKIQCEFPVSVSGGVWKSHPILFETFAYKVKKELPFVNVLKPLFEPVVGCVLLGLRDLGYNIKDNKDHLKMELASYSQTKWFDNSSASL